MAQILKTTAGWDPAVEALAGLSPLPPTRTPVPASLATEVIRFSALLGVPLDASTVHDQVAHARLGHDTETALSILINQLASCTLDTRQLLAHTPHASLVTEASRVQPDDIGSLRGCSVTLRSLVDQILPVLRRPHPGAGPLTLWPVLSYSPSPKGGHTYVEDYALQIESGSNNTFLNNAGSNQLDLKRSVSSPAARLHQPARGCFETYPDSTTGRIVEGPGGTRVPSVDGPECTPAAALLLDLGGHNTYGALQPPTFPDTQCSTDPSVHRMSTIGVGVEGVGMLIDLGGHNSYYGRTVTMGAGHLGGVGLLEDFAGHNTYLAMRNGQGLGLLGGAGILRNHGGDSRYDYYMPRPLRSDARFQTDGAGGVADDSGLATEVGRGPHQPDGSGGRCDNLERSIQGVGIFVPPAVGVLVNEHGGNYFRAAGYANQDGGFPLLAPFGSEMFRFAQGSQASGYLGGFGVMLQFGGSNSYVLPDGSPRPDRHDGMLEGPTAHPAWRDPQHPDNGQELDAHLFYTTG